MKANISRVLGLLAVLTAPIHAPAQSETESVDVTAGEARSIPLLSAEQLDELLGPIALYPDALIALILPASTMPTDLVLAARYLSAGGDPAKVDEQPWDESVRGLAHYPDVVKWMDEKLSWAIIMGDAFVAQPVDVMQSVQRLRARARAAGTLVDSAEQKVVEEEGAIRIVPARPEVIYVPYYDPQVVYVSRPSWSVGWYAPVVTYPWCYPSGIWLSYDCDWYSSRVWCVNTYWRHDWYYGRSWWRPYPHSPRHYYGNHDYGHGWAPPHGGGHHDYRRGGRDRSSHVVIRDGHREYPRSPGSGSYQPRPDGNRGGDRGRDGGYADGRGGSGGRNSPDVRGGGPDRGREDNGSGRGVSPGGRDNPDTRSGGTHDRARDGNYADGRRGGRAPGGERADRSDGDDRRGPVPDTRSGGSTRPDRRPETPRVVTNPSSPRVDAPPATSRPPVTAPRNPPVVRNSEPARNPAPSPGRWIDRATNPGRTPTVRSDTPAPRPAPSAPRVTQPPQERSAVVRVPVAGGGSRSVVVNSSPRAERVSPPPAPSSEARAPSGESRAPRASRGGNDGGGEKSAGRRRSNDG